jgi:FPC/CPF motif-containing protein YcgG
MLKEIISIVDAYKNFIGAKNFPCIAARAALASRHINCMVADDMACAKDDKAILHFLYQFIDSYRVSQNPFHSAAIIFKTPQATSEELFDDLLWQRLQALTNLDSENYRWDQRVSSNPASAHFSFSIKEEAFFVIGLHPASSRASRRFEWPALVFNPHAEFQKLRATNHYETMKETVRKRDSAYSGSVNPMLNDFGEVSEVRQYSGRMYEGDWECPLKITQAISDKL